MGRTSTHSSERCRARERGEREPSVNDLRGLEDKDSLCARASTWVLCVHSLCVQALGCHVRTSIHQLPRNWISTSGLKQMACLLNGEPLSPLGSIQLQQLAPRVKEPLSQTSVPNSVLKSRGFLMDGKSSINPGLG